MEVEGPDDGSPMKFKALLDSGSSASFISVSLSQNLHLPRYNPNAKISGVVLFTRNSVHPITTFHVFSEFNPEKLSTLAVIVSRVTYDLPLNIGTFDQNWNNLMDLQF